MIRLLVAAVALVLATTQAGAQAQQQPPPPRTYTQEQLWNRVGDRIAFTPAGISLTQRARVVSYQETGEVSNPGRGLDNVIQFRSADGQVLATGYIYYVPLAHAGLSAFATEQGLELISENSLRRVRAGTVPAGAVADGAVRIDYRGFRGTMASSAAFIKAGRWMIKLRVSGPGERQSDVEAAMTALLASLRFDGEARPRTATLLDLDGCDSSPGSTARMLPDSQDTLADALFAAFDPTGETPVNSRPGTGEAGPLLARFGSGWCISSRARIGNQTVPILRATAPAPTANGRVNAQTVAVAIISDAGTLIEVVRADAGRFTILHHRIGQTIVLGAYGDDPTDEQIANILSGADRAGGQARARVGLRIDGGTEVELRSVPGLTNQPRT